MSGLSVKPFRALRYDFRRTSLSAAVCPPYDVIRGPFDARLRRGPRNAVHVELPRGKEPYRAAKALFKRWRSLGILIEEAAPAFYVVEQSYTARGRRLKRTGVLTALGLDRPTAARVLRHERTLSKHKKDRARLIRAVKVNTSPIFGVFADRGGKAARVLAAAKRARPLAAGRDAQGVGTKLWRLDDPKAVVALESALRPETLLIADGHHRYEVARAHWEATRQKGAGRVLAYIASERDAGLVVFPTHRVVVDSAQLRSALTRSCTARPFPGLAALMRALARERSPYALGLAGPSFSLLTPKASDRGVKSRFGTDWLAQRILGGVDPHDIAYYHEAGDAAAEARRSGRLALLLKDFTVTDIRKAVTRAGLLPQKSTYFFPKICTGLAFRAFDLDP